MSGERLWTRTFVTLMAINFISALSFYLLMVKITEYTIQTYGVSYSAGASTVTAFVISALFARLFLGGRIDVWGIRRSLAAGMLLNAVSCALYLVPMPLACLLCVRVMHGVGFALASGAAGAGAALIVPARRRGEGIGYFSMMQALATGVGPFVAIALTSGTQSYTVLFAFTAGVCVAALAACFILEMPAANAVAQEEKTVRRLGLASLVQVAVLPLAAVMLLAYVCYSGILSFVVLYAAEEGLQDSVGLYFVVYAVAILVTRPPIGRRVDRKGENSSIYWSLCSLVVGMVVLAFAVNGALLLASAALCGFGIGATQSIIQAVIARDTPHDELGRANSTFFMSMDLGSGVGPVVIGAFIPLAGYRAVYLALAVVALLAGVLYHAVHGSKAGRSQEKSS